MRFVTAALIMALIGGPTATGAAETNRSVQKIVTQEIAALPVNGPGGAAVAVRIAGRTWFFSFGMADQAAKRPITSDSNSP